MIKPVEKRQSLVEIALGFRRAGLDRTRVRTQTFKKWFLGVNARENNRGPKQGRTETGDRFHMLLGG